MDAIIISSIKYEESNDYREIRKYFKKKLSNVNVKSYDINYKKLIIDEKE